MTYFANQRIFLVRRTALPASLNSGKPKLPESRCWSEGEGARDTAHIRWTARKRRSHGRRRIETGIMKLALTEPWSDTATSSTFSVPLGPGFSTDLERRPN
jgi:hypothetical protein